MTKPRQMSQMFFFIFLEKFIKLLAGVTGAKLDGKDKEGQNALHIVTKQKDLVIEGFFSLFLQKYFKTQNNPF